jgi:hypothetical protein
VILVVSLLIFFLVQAFLSSIVFGFFALLLLICFQQIFRVLLEVILVPKREMDVTFENNDDLGPAAGILMGKDRWYLFLDGITNIQKLEKNTWTLDHFNGTALHISASAITEEQLEFVRSIAKEGQTPEGIRKVIERGRKIKRLLDN